MSDSISINGHTRPHTQFQTLLELLHELKTPPTGVAVAVNNQIIPKARHAELQIEAGDCIEIVHAVGGG